MNISDEEAQRLISIKKIYAEATANTDTTILTSKIKGRKRFNFLSEDERDNFLITFERKGILLECRTNCLIGAKVIPLVRLDIGKPQ